VCELQVDSAIYQHTQISAAKLHINVLRTNTHGLDNTTIYKHCNTSLSRLCHELTSLCI